VLKRLKPLNHLRLDSGGPKEKCIRWGVWIPLRKGAIFTVAGCGLSSKFFDHLLLLLVRFLILCEWFNIMQMIGIVLTSAEREVWSATHAELLSLT